MDTYFERLREKCPYLEFLWTVFSRIRTEYGPEKLRIGTVLRSVNFRS